MLSNAKKTKDGKAIKFTNHDRARPGDDPVVTPTGVSSALAPGSQNELELGRERFNSFLARAKKATGVEHINRGLGQADTGSIDGLSGANEQLKSNMRENCQQAGADIDEMEKQANRETYKYYVILIVFLVIGVLLGIYVPEFYDYAATSKYTRENLDSLVNTEFAGKYFPDITTKELMVVSYEYNSQQPRFYSKYYNNIDPAIYNVSVAQACESSSSAPTFFNPKLIQNGYGHNELNIDGGIICNNPSLYAYEMARDLYGYKNIRILSLGTG